MGERTKAHCNKCGAMTNHDTLGSERTSWEESTRWGVVDGWNQYDMLKCCGCDSVTMRHVSYCSEGDGPSTVQYPPPIAGRNPERAHVLWEKDWSLGGWLNEIYIAL
jgi:hypothetical protein